MELNNSDLALMLEWFHAVQDVNPAYLEQKDYVMAAQLMNHLKRRVPNSVKRRLPNG